MIGLVDTHAHLCHPTLAEDLEEVLERAAGDGVVGVVAVGETLADARVNLSLADRFPGVVLPTAGLFPTILDLEAAEELIEFMRAMPSRWAAVGEVGLDFWKVQDERGRALQRHIFERFIDLAAELDRPINVHSRSAGAKTIECLLERGARKVQLHAFDGRAAKALPAVEAGYYFSVPPSIVRSPQKQKLVRRLPLSCLLLETDSPVLSAVPGARNEPREVLTALAAVAEIKQLSPEEVAEVVRTSTERLYGAVVPAPGSR